MKETIYSLRTLENARNGQAPGESAIAGQLVELVISSHCFYHGSKTLEEQAALTAFHPEEQTSDRGNSHRWKNNQLEGKREGEFVNFGDTDTHSGRSQRKISLIRNCSWSDSGSTDCRQKKVDWKRKRAKQDSVGLIR